MYYLQTVLAAFVLAMTALVGACSDEEQSTTYNNQHGVYIRESDRNGQWKKDKTDKKEMEHKNRDDHKWKT